MNPARARGKPDGPLLLRNRQRLRKVDLRLLRRIVAAAIVALPGHAKSNRPPPARPSAGPAQSVELGIYLVPAAEMTRLNETYLRHRGSTDVITFDYSESLQTGLGLAGEIFICIEEAISQGRRFRTGWQSEMVRYIVHGLLHLNGFDDLRPSARRKMKRAENRLLRGLAREFNLRRLAGPNPRSAAVLGQCH